MLLISNSNPNICFTCNTKLVIKLDFTFYRTFSKVKKKCIALVALGIQKKLLHDYGKILFYNFKVCDIKADNIIICLWFQTAYYGDRQPKNLTAY